MLGDPHLVDAVVRADEAARELRDGRELQRARRRRAGVRAIAGLHAVRLPTVGRLSACVLQLERVARSLRLRFAQAAARGSVVVAAR